MVPKVHWYTIDPIWTPLWGYMRGKSSKKWQNCIFSGSLEWNHIGWKSFMILNIFISQIQIFPKFLYNWENWEIFANFISRNFLSWFLDSWQTFEWNFGATCHKLFFDLLWPQFSQQWWNLGKIWIWQMKMLKILQLFHPILFHSSEPENIQFCHFLELWPLM